MDRRWLRNLDVVLLSAVVLLLLFGLLVVYSATRGLAETRGDSFYYVKRQAIAALLGFAAMAVVLTVDYRHLIKLSRLFYLGSLLLLAAVLVVGRVGGGAERWLAVGPLSLQPSEVAKISLTLSLASALSDRERVEGWRGIFIALAWLVPMWGLILLQPDLGTAMTMAGMTLGVLIFAGAPMRNLALLTAAGLGAAVAAVVGSIQGWLPVLKPYQVNRLIVFFDPYRYRHDEGWNVIQSMIAIGSGNLFGKGLFGGSQTQLNFLPARHTDFIFSVIGEEFGFVGGAFVLLLFGVVFWRGGRILLQAKDSMGSLLVAGVLSMIFCHVLINIGMTLGLMPVTGLPLPLISYGGTSVLTTLTSIGLVLNVGLRRKKIHF
ncbi:MAG: rod shape-determining protein RodA [Firmicutes bacterium ZCTH02-B6]|nr:MAG: rod shape-determining protein RodA [Firmicutes bacterium ZCTH02-B6]